MGIAFRMLSTHDSLCDFSFQLEMGVLREQVRYSKMSAKNLKCRPKLNVFFMPAFLELVKWGSRFRMLSTHDSSCDFSFQLEMGVLREQNGYSKISA